VGRKISALERGYTLLEALIVLAIIGIIAAISIPALTNQVQEYRLNTSAREVMANIALTRLKAITSNFKVTFTYTRGTPDTYQISGSEDQNGDGFDLATQPWEDANGNGVLDGLRDTDNDGNNDATTMYSEAREIRTVSFDTNLVPNPLPSGEDPADAPASGSSVTLKYAPNGRLDSSDPIRSIILKNQRGTVYVIWVDLNGFVKISRCFVGGAWQEVS